MHSPSRLVFFSSLVLVVAGCAGGFSPVRFDLAAARADVHPTFGARRDAGNGVAIEEVTFVSTQWNNDGYAHEIRIRAVLARPVKPGRRPAVLVAHGLGSAAEPDVAVEIARNLDVVALAVSAPGLGGSEGTPVTFQDPSLLFATAPDPRGSWLYAYVYTLLRAVTLLQALPDVDGHVVLSGTSLGGLASLIANGSDDRIAGALVMSASGGLETAAREGSWLRTLVEAAKGQHLDDAGPRAFFRAFDPLAYAETQHGAVYLLSGAQDEFFPMDQVLRTFQALRAPQKSLALVPDYDHGWYFGHGCSARCMPGAPTPDKDCHATCPRTCAGRWPYCGPHDAYNRQPEVTARWALLLRSLVAQVSQRPFDPPPPIPVITRRADELFVAVGMARVKEVRLAVSDNGGYTYGQEKLQRLPDGAFFLRRHLPDDAIVIAEVEGTDGAVVTSIPKLPAHFWPPIRPFSDVEKEVKEAQSER